MAKQDGSNNGRFVVLPSVIEEDGEIRVKAGTSPVNVFPLCVTVSSCQEMTFKFTIQDGWQIAEK